MFCIFALILLKMYWKGISKMELVLFCFMGHWPNPHLTDKSPGNLDFQDFRIFGTLRNPSLWIWIYQIISRSPRNSITVSGKGYVLKIVIRLLKCLESWDRGILELRNFDIRKLRNFETWNYWNLGTLKFWDFETLNWVLG